MVELKDFAEEFIKQLHIQMAGAGRVLDDSEVLIIRELVNQAKKNGLTKLS